MILEQYNRISIGNLKIQTAQQRSIVNYKN